MTALVTVTKSPLASHPTRRFLAVEPAHNGCRGRAGAHNPPSGAARATLPHGDPHRARRRVTRPRMCHRQRPRRQRPRRHRPTLRPSRRHSKAARGPGLTPCNRRPGPSDFSPLFGERWGMRRRCSDKCRLSDMPSYGSRQRRDLFLLRRGPSASVRGPSFAWLPGRSEAGRRPCFVAVSALWLRVLLLAKTRQLGTARKGGAPGAGTRRTHGSTPKPESRWAANPHDPGALRSSFRRRSARSSPPGRERESDRRLKART
jgi:hypothetical protein